jgi:hypothetical protein
MEKDTTISVLVFIIFIIESPGHRCAVANENESATALRVQRDDFASHSHRTRSAVASQLQLTSHLR